MMPDISMCNSVFCPIKDTCYRHEAQPNGHWQAYANFDAQRIRDGICTSWLPYCKNCGQQVNTLIKMGGEICAECRVILRLPHQIPKERYGT